MPLPLTELSADELNRVVAHPAQVSAMQTIAFLIEELRRCEDPADYEDFQRALFQHLFEAETYRGQVRRVIKRLRRGASIPNDAPALSGDSSMSDVASWRYEELTYERICRQLRAVGDALAWRVTGFDRQYVLTLSRNASPGPMADKEGLPWELGAVVELWRERRHFALLHDLTSCLRIGDITEFTADGKRLLHEVKKNNARRDKAQVHRMEAAVAAIMHGAALPGDQPARLVSVDVDLRTHLAVLADAAALAEERGIIGVKVPGGRAVTCACALTLLSQGNGEDVPPRWEQARGRACRRARIDRVAHHLTANSADRASRSPVAAPYGVYPLTARQCAQLICDYMIFDVVMAPGELVSACARHGLRGQLLLPASAGNLGDEQPVFRFFSGNDAVVVHAPAMQQLLLELIDLDVYAAALGILLSKGEAGVEPVLSFRGEREIWR
jgi:hypothetical protein